MASYLRPRRGKKATAIAQLTASAPLKRGEVFFEVPDAGTGTGAGRIKMGDGSTAYESLPYFLEPFDPDSATVGFTDATEAEADPYTSNATHTNAIVPAANFKTIFTNLKQLLLNYNSQFTKLNNDLTQTNDKIEEIQSHPSDTFIKKMKLLGRSNSDVVELNESFKEYDAIYVSSFRKDPADRSKISTSIFAFSEDINVGEKITLLQESNGTTWDKIFLTISSETSFKANNKYYTTVIGINL